MRVHVYKDTDKGASVLIVPRRGFGLPPVLLQGPTNEGVQSLVPDAVEQVTRQELAALYGVSHE